MNDDRWMSRSPPGRSRDGVSPDWRSRWFERDAAARVIVSRQLEVLAINPIGEALLENHATIGVRDGVLSARDRRSAAQLADAVANAGAASQTVVVVVAGGGPDLLLDALSLDHGPESPVGLILRDPSVAPDIDCADLEALFGVTPGEHQVIVQLLKGYSSREIAQQAGKSILTIRTHVKRAYGKIGVKTRGQLFARLLRYLSIR